jgi:hypothetical protein
VHEPFDSIVTSGTPNDTGEKPIVCPNGVIDVISHPIVGHDGPVDIHEGINAAGGRVIDPGRDALNG